MYSGDMIMRHFCKLVFKVGCSGDSCLSQLRYLVSLLIQPREQTSLKTLKRLKNHRRCFVINKITVIAITEYFSNFSNQGRGKLIDSNYHQQAVRKIES